MKMLKKPVLLIVLLIFATVLVSWNYLNNSEKELNTSRRFCLQAKNLDGLTEAEINVLIAEDDGFTGSPQQDRKAPPAEDVLIQKVPGDNAHLLMMAFYSKENCSRPLVSIENGGHVVFRDDGTGYDKKAGDGLYTARVVADLNEFRKKALSMATRMKKNGYKPLRFDHRTMIVDPDADRNRN